MATVTLLAKARQGRLAALASLKTRDSRPDNVVSIFDFAFEEPRRADVAHPANVIEFHSRRALIANENRTLEHAA